MRVKYDNSRYRGVCKTPNIKKWNADMRDSPLSHSSFLHVILLFLFFLPLMYNDLLSPDLRYIKQIAGL